MATRTFTDTRDATFGNKAHYVSWTGLLNGDDGSPYAMPGWADRTVQITGTFGAGGTVVIEGSIDGTNYVTLTDPQGNAISKTGAAIETITEIVKFIRPRVTAGDGTTSLACSLMVRRAF